MTVQPTDGPDSDWPGEEVVSAAMALLDLLSPVGTCPGVLVVHVDGTAAACSEELDGRCCAGGDHPHVGTITCRDLLGSGGCEVCAPVGEEADWDDPAWRHAMRVGVIAAGRDRCRQHLAVRPR